MRTNAQQVRRKSYARIPDVLPLPHLIQVQLQSYRWFQEEGLRELFDEISPIESFNGNLELHFPGLNEEINEKLGLDYRFEEPKYTQQECLDRDMTYAAPSVCPRCSVEQGERRVDNPGRIHG